MNGVRRAWVDRHPGEARGLITLDGRPERLLVVREDDAVPRIGQRFGARVDAVSGRLGLARLDLGSAPATLKLKSAAPPSVGERLFVEVVVEPNRGKPAGVRRMGGDAPAAPGALTPPPDLETQLEALGVTSWEAGEEAADQIDEAQAEALVREHLIGPGLTLTIETTRALTAVDVDLAESGAPVSVANANALAIGEAARLLRLKALGGLVAIDLIGFPKDRDRILAVAREAFALDGPEVHIAPPSRFGVLELAKPHARQPLHEQFLDANGRPTARTAAQTLVRALERQGRFAPGVLLVARCTPEVAAEAGPYVRRLGPRFTVQAEAGLGRETCHISER